MSPISGKTNKRGEGVSMFSNVKWYLVRRWVYGVAMAVGGILVYLKVIEPAALLVYIPLVLALFNANPPATPDETAGE